MPDFISYVRGDATAPKSKPAFILHVVNDCGLWGKGFVMALSSKWKEPEQTYRAVDSYPLGNVHYSDVEPGVTVVNMIAQRGIYSPGHKHHQNQPLVYDALYRCLDKVAARAKGEGATLHMPKIGAGLAKGDWSIVSQIIESVCRTYDVQAAVYEL